jgi:hypothetical protein
MTNDELIALATLEQPAPVHGPASQSVLDNVTWSLGPDHPSHLFRDLLLARRRKGMQPPPDGYGMELKTHDGRNHRVDALQEGLDLFMYLRAVRQEVMDAELGDDELVLWNSLCTTTGLVIQGIMQAIRADPPSSPRTSEDLAVSETR